MHLLSHERARCGLWYLCTYVDVVLHWFTYLHTHTYLLPTIDDNYNAYVYILKNDPQYGSVHIVQKFLFLSGSCGFSVQT